MTAAWLHGISDELLVLVESRLCYARGQCHTDEAREEIAKRMDECRTEVHRRAAAKAAEAKYL